MTSLTLAFTEEAREFLKADGHGDFVWQSVNLPTFPAIGDCIWLDDADPMLRFVVVKRTFIRSLLSEDVAVELELGLPPLADESAPD